MKFLTIEIQAVKSMTPVLHYVMVFEAAVHNNTKEQIPAIGLSQAHHPYVIVFKTKNKNKNKE